MKTIYLSEIPEQLYRALDYSKIHTTRHGEAHQVQSINKLGGRYRVHLTFKRFDEYATVKEAIIGGEYRYDEEQASNLLLDIY